MDYGRLCPPPPPTNNNVKKYYASPNTDIVGSNIADYVCRKMLSVCTYLIFM